MSKNKHVIIAGGKTGGHLFPGIAVAQALMEKDPATKILFVGTRAPFEIQTLARYGFAHKSIISKPIKGKNLFAKIWSAGLVGISLIQALGIIIAFRADFILGVGGFSSFALVLAGRILFKETAIHEQNAFPGMTNRMLSKIARTRFISFKATQGMPENDTTFLVGNPVRRPLSTAQENSMTDECVLNRINADDFLILVTGGSQGAASINAAFIQAVAMMKETHRLFIIHQTGATAEAQIQQFYAAGDIRHKAAAFFYDMPAIQDRADLVISRAGAGTVSELCIKGKPAILVPYPHAADDHQTANAKSLADQGACIMIADKDLTGETLSAAIENLRHNTNKRTGMADTMTSLAMPHGADLIADRILGADVSKKEDNVPA
ncbi:undecaprenyldiphospho-muramoylpentapeptide beta-N-acetylglucosaminyltransferase [Desulfobacter latus]|uniref:UDP-N-acetylglucosamine--N-acetylmuramyl-(pentapeptide) pyrophosphoryl-undecaprenol N-acetylglucosamine transferase n=1 Tax=Desulfobacter latus TaxID=2292 RepID=A0A850T8I4_9BACT|nr:undecaprenyldiphospho-muramoylpentapeptide beta-N-acetylglucosaminyltransferase [Desulfobacter latus]NWH04758.1 undecaprenyldiphospho-muramoylpentapeptide beta-N-acetylglucosaminyltransferase [Desulfobacter latus]